tara:strand:- start:10 stop:1242 length:1233 start_codon:yes stop_codon:yes gene_type:complete
MNNTNPLQEAANQLASRGRYGDTMMVHMNPIEVDALAQLSPTGQLTTNPHTGQPEAFLPLLFSMIAPSLIGAGTAAGLSSLAASAIGSGIGTIAEGGSLQEGLTAGLMGGLTGGLLKGVMPEGLDLLGKGATEAVPEAIGTTAADIGQALGGGASPMMSGVTDALSVVPEQVVQQATPTFGQNLMGGIESALGPEGLPDTIGSLGAGMVGEMYVPWDTPEALGEESEYQYEGPYMPTEQRRMIATGDPLQSAFEAEQQMLEGNVFPPGFNMRYGGLVKRLQKGGMARTQEDIENMAAEQRWMSDMNKQRADAAEFNRLQEALAAPRLNREPVVEGGEPKRFRDYQPEGMLKGTVFDYVPDPVQTSRFLMDRLNREPAVEETAMSPDQQFIEERERLKKRGRRKLMEPVRR